MKINKFLIINLVIIALTILNLFFINSATQERIKDYSYMIATKVTKQIVTTAYNSKSYHVDNNKLYEIIYGSNDDIKTIVYNSSEVNKFLDAVTENVYDMFNNLEYGDLSKINIRENIVVNDKKNFTKDGIVIMIPSGIVSNNYLFANLGPRIPVKISLTGEFESCISTKVEEYGLNNALISIYINIKATEQITMPFITEKVEIENQIPLSIYVVNGKIPEYYINGFDRTSNIYRSNN